MAIGDTTTGIELLIGNGGPDPVASLLATNLHTLALESGLSTLSDGADGEDEYYFNGVSINVASAATLNGFTAGARYYVDTEVANPDYDPTDPDSKEFLTERSYPEFILDNSTFTVTAAGAPTDRPVFATTTNAESLFTPNTGTYVGGSYATAGIVNGSQYIYTKVFNQSNFSFIPRLAPEAQDIVVPTNGGFPNAPEINDPANGIYPVNTITAFAPDSRRTVTLTFTYTVNYKLTPEGNTTTVTNTIEQPVSQPIDNYGPTLQAMLTNSYYGQGNYGMDQWPDDEPALYATDGSIISPAPRPDALIPDSSTSSGFAEYNQATYGAGFPQVADSAIADQVFEDIETRMPGGFEIPGVDYTTDTYDNENVDATEYLF